MSLDILCTRVCFGSFVAWSMELYGFSGVWGGSVVRIVLGGLSGERHWYGRAVWDSWGFLLSRGSWRRWAYHSQNFRYETLGTPLLKVCPSYFISFESHKRIKGTFLSFSLIKKWMKMNEYLIALWCFWRTSESHNSLSSWYILKLPFVIEWRIVEVLGTNFGPCRPLGGEPWFFVFFCLS